MAELRVLLEALSKEPNIRGRQFERICRWFLESSPVYTSVVQKVWLWDDWPGRWGRDAGIDLVAKTRDGDLWAMQAKNYELTHWITKSDVDTFLAQSARKQFAYRLIIATTNRIGMLAKEQIDAQEKRVGLLLLSDLERAGVDWPVSPDLLRGKPPKPKKPFPHNREAVRNMCRGLLTVDRGQLVMACGTGKTLVGLWASEKLGSRRTLVLLPSLSLLAQTMREWTANRRIPFEYLAVCSDETVRGADHFVEHVSELGVPVTTDPDEIASFMGRRGRLVVFATYQSSPRIAAAFQKRRLPWFDLAIGDEAHRCAGLTSSDFATILDPLKIRARRRLFMTATPRYFTNRVRREATILEFEVASMDDERVFGPVLHRLSFGEAIERGLLSDYQVFVVGVDDEACRSLADRAALVIVDGREVTDARTLAAQIGLAKAMTKYDLRRVVSFHSRISQARSFARSFLRTVEWIPRGIHPSGRLWAEYVSGEMPSGTRDSLLRRFEFLEKDERGLLSNARCLGEGVNVPAIDGVAFVEPRRSPIDIVQAVGRAVRRSEEKKIGTIILPVFVDPSVSPEVALEASAFRPLWEVLKALRAHDEELAEQLDALRRELGKRLAARIRLPSKVKIDLPLSVGPDFVRAFEVRLVEQTTASWEFWFGLLQRFVDREGHPLVPHDRSEEGFPLGYWVNNQRAFYKRGILREERKRRLQALPGWVWDTDEAGWEEGFARLSDFVSREGNARVSANHVESGFLLGRWINKQRTAHKNGSLRADRIVRLQTLPGWSWNVREEAWREAFQRLVRFVKGGSDADVPVRHIETGFKLGAWVHKQRDAWRKGLLPDEKAALLESVPGWTWRGLSARWEKGFRQLEAFLQRTRSADVRHAYVDQDGFRLGNWVTRQREFYRENKLHPDRIRRLESLPGWSWVTGWERGYRYLCEYLERHGTALVLNTYRVPEGFRLGNWVATQRRAYMKDELSPNQIGRLQSLTGWSWYPKRDAWEEKFELLLRFVRREGHARVPSSAREGGTDLGGWVVGQRAARNKGRLNAERVRHLETLAGWTWDTREAVWEEAFSRLLEYVTREGRAKMRAKHVEPDGFRLGGWVDEQRQAYKNGKLRKERIARFESVSGWTWALGPHQIKSKSGPPQLD